MWLLKAIRFEFLLFWQSSSHHNLTIDEGSISMYGRMVYDVFVHSIELKMVYIQLSIKLLFFIIYKVSLTFIRTILLRILNLGQENDLFLCHIVYISVVIGVIANNA